MTLALEENKKYWKQFSQEDRMCGIDINLFEKLIEDLFINFKNKSILDFGCGTGRIYPFFSKICKDYFGVDITQEVLNLFKAKYPSAKFSLIEGFDIPINDESFDVIWCWSVFTHYPIEDIEEMLKELKRILKKDGKIYCSFIISENLEEDYQEVGFFTHRQQKIEELFTKLGFKLRYPKIIFPTEGFMLKQTLMELRL